MAAEQKTNVMRLLEQKKVAYTPHHYPAADPVPDGVTIAALVGKPAEQVFKTLVTRGASGQYYVFVVPVARSLDLKKAARAVGERSIAMLPQRELLPLTGYVHGGCSPLGMKKPFRTTIAEEAAKEPTILVSAGRVGDQVELPPDTLLTLVRQGSLADLTAEAE